MKIPFPSISSTLAVSSHMYICIKSEKKLHEFVKCQTLKPYMLSNRTIQNYCDEKPDINRNPFKRSTRIDCDKIFKTINVNYDEKLLTTYRSDICEELFFEIIKKLSESQPNIILLDEDSLVSLNLFIAFI